MDDLNAMPHAMVTAPSGAAGYLRAAAHRDLTRRWRAVLAAFLIERPLARRRCDWIATGRSDDDKDTAALIARLAADGLWLSDLLGISKPSTEECQTLQEALLSRSGLGRAWTS